MAETTVEKRNSSHGIEKKDSAYKRSNKPYMEKKRRARINNCLTQLKSLVLQAMRKDTNQYSKLEKADILEMTVKHLRQLQRQHVSQAMSCDPTVATKYKAGFNECANEVMRYLSSVQGVETEVRNRLVNHLGGLVSHVNTPTDAQQLNVQIPQSMNQGLQNVPSGCLLMPAGVQTSPLVLQSQNNSNIYHSGHNQQVLSQQQQQQQQHGQTQFCGSFQIVPNTSSPGAVAVYLGQASQNNNSHPNTQTSPVLTNHAVPLYSSHTPPRTKASLKAFDSTSFTHDNSAFLQVSGSDRSNNSSPSFSPNSQESNMSSKLDFSIHGLSVKCGRTPSPLKVEDVWRPW